jgi:hypothetical protein
MRAGIAHHDRYPILSDRFRIADRWREHLLCRRPSRWFFRRYCITLRQCDGDRRRRRGPHLTRSIGSAAPSLVRPFDERSWRSRGRTSVSRMLVDCGDIGGEAGGHVKEVLHGGLHTARPVAHPDQVVSTSTTSGSRFPVSSRGAWPLPHRNRRPDSQSASMSRNRRSRREISVDRPRTREPLGTEP